MHDILHMHEGPLKDKSLDYAVQMVELYKLLKSQKNEHVMSEKLMRSGVAIGSWARQGSYSTSTEDVLEKFHSAYNSINENQYWLMLLHRTGYLEEDDFQNYQSNNQELNDLISQIIESARNRIN